MYLCPTRTALQLSLNAPARISLALAVRSFTRRVSGACVRACPFIVVFGLMPPLSSLFTIVTLPAKFSVLTTVTLPAKSSVEDFTLFCITCYVWHAVSITGHLEWQYGTNNIEHFDMQCIWVWHTLYGCIHHLWLMWRSWTICMCNVSCNTKLIARSATKDKAHILRFGSLNTEKTSKFCW